MQLRVEDDRVTEISVQGTGCAITQASASIMGESTEGKQFAEVAKISGAFRRMLSESEAPDAADEDLLGDAIALRDVSRFPIRIKCALLPWATLEDAIANYNS